jgi:hypothetical protein
MNEPENKPSVEKGAYWSNETCEDLRRQITVLFGALVVTSFTLTAFLGLEARRASAELSIIKPRAEDAEKAISQDNATVQAVFSKLEEFGHTHPDFQSKILVKYKLNSNATKVEPKK